MLADFKAGRTQLVSFGWSNSTGAIDLRMYRSILEGKSSFKKLGLTFSSKLDWGSDTISTAKINSVKNWSLNLFSEVFSPGVC